MKKTQSLQSALVVAALGFGWLVAAAQGQDGADRRDHEEGVADGVVVERDVDSQTILVKIPAKDGKVAWKDVLKAVMRAGQLDDTSLKDRLPSGSFDLEQSYSRYTLWVINRALAPDISMRIVPAEAGKRDAQLLVTIAEGALRDKKRKLSKRIRDKMKRAGGPKATVFGLRMPDGWNSTSQQTPLVIVVHGFNSSPQRFGPVAKAFRDAGLVAGTYSYPDDQPIAESAEQLSNDLKKLATDHPRRPVLLVTHSMGGLVARAAIENPELDPGNVTQLIMVAPPTHGSLLAQFAFGLDILDHAVPESDRKELSRFYAAIEDGMSEAREDLSPDSPFLRKLNHRPRNPNVRYSIFLGTGGRLTRQQVDKLRDGLKVAKAHSDVAGLFVPRLDATLADLDEVIRGKGDGVVAVKRGRLDGVDDIVVMDFTHLGALQNPEELADDALFHAVLARLKKPGSRGRDY